VIFIEEWGQEEIIVLIIEREEGLIVLVPDIGADPTIFKDGVPSD
jgi:hypothetical protein